MESSNIIGGMSEPQKQERRVKFGVNTFLWTENFGSKDFKLLSEISAHGFDGVEVSLIDPGAFEAANIRRAMQEHHLSCTVCSVFPSGLSLIADDAGVRAKAVSHLSDCIQLTAEAGAELIAGPLYSPVGYLPGRRRTTDEWKWAVEAYQKVGPVLNRYAVELCIEPLNRFETFFLNTTSDAVALCSEVNHPNIGILWDTFHANIEEKRLSDSLLTAGSFLKHVHTSENDRGTPGTGHVDWPAVFAALNELGYRRWLTIESFGFSLGSLSSAASIWRDLATSPELIAWDGVRFLKSESARYANA
jgi:D-psicose/D-tagatose/L-ribulose 3-epimerase